MAAKKKTYKRLTNAEKKIRKEARQELIELGFIKPKKRLNRKTFCKEAKEQFKEFMGTYGDFQYVLDGISYMLPFEFEEKTLEHVGVCKVLKIAVAIKQYKKELKAAGETKYNELKMYEEVIKPIREA